MWLRRISRQIAQSDKPILVSSRHYEVSVIAQTMLERDGRTYWIEFGAEDPEHVGRQRWGFGDQFELHDLAAAVRFHEQLIHRSVRPILILTKVEHALNEVVSLLNNVNDSRHRILVSGTASAIDAIAVQIVDGKVASPTDIDMTLEEIADHLLGHGFTDVGEWDYSVPRTLGRVRALELSRLGLPMENAPRPAGGTGIVSRFTRGESTVLEVLMKNRQWSKALDIAISTNEQGVFMEILDIAGEEAMHTQRLVEFRRKLDSLPGHLRESDVALYWMLVTEISLRLSTGIVDYIRRLMVRRSLPRVAVFWNVLGLDKHATLEELQLSGRDLPTEMYLAHLQSFNGNPEYSVRTLRRILNEIDAQTQPYRTVQAMLMLTNSLVMNGCYESALSWGETTTRTAVKLRSDELEQSVASALTAYAHMLVSSREDAGEKLSHIRAEDYRGLPYAESIFSTMADFFALADYCDEALDWYESAIRGAPQQVVDIINPDIALCLVRLDRSSEAEARFKEQLEVVDSASNSAQWAEFALAVAQIQSNPDESISVFERLINRPGTVLTGPYLARAGILLAILLLRANRDSQALASLNSVAHAVKDLGPDGWSLLSGNAPEVMLLSERWHEAYRPVVMRFMGGSDWYYGDYNSHTIGSRRLKELLFVLSCHPDGITGDKLTAIMSPEGQSESTVRSHIHRLKKIVPLNSAPYKFAARIESDYLNLRRAISEHDLDGALDSFRGPLFPDSDLAFVREIRLELESALRMLIVEEGSPEQLARFALAVGDDLDVLEQAYGLVSQDSSLRAPLQIRIQQLRLMWGED